MVLSTEITILFLIVMVIILAAAGGTMAVDTSTIAVSATVLAGTCRFSSGGTIAFTLDPSTGGNELCM
jgi:type 1 fimbria pilin